MRILLDQFHRNYSNYIRLIPHPRGWDKIGGDVSNVRMGGDVTDICSDEKLRVRNRVEKEKRGGIRISLNCDSSIS